MNTDASDIVDVRDKSGTSHNISCVCRCASAFGHSLWLHACVVGMSAVMWVGTYRPHLESLPLLADMSALLRASPNVVLVQVQAVIYAGCDERCAGQRHTEEYCGCASPYLERGSRFASRARGRGIRFGREIGTIRSAETAEQ